MAKVSIEEVEEQLTALQAPKSLMEDLVKRLQQLIDEEKAEKEAEGPKPKYEHVLVGVGPDFDPNTSMFLAKVIEGADHNDLPDHILTAARNYNRTQAEKKKRHRKPDVTKVGVAFEVLTAKVIPEETFKIAQKTPLIAIRIDCNDLPMDKGLQPATEAATSGE